MADAEVDVSRGFYVEPFAVEITSATEGADYVLHQAAIPSVQRSIEDPARSNEVNVDGTLNLLLAAREAGVRRFVSASSSSLYGESEVLPKVETMTPNPISPYALQKLAGETYGRLFLRGRETRAQQARAAAG